MEALGRVFNARTSATTGAEEVSLVDATGVTFFLTGATSGNATIQETKGDGSGQNLAVITHYYRKNAGVWARVDQAAAATVTAATGGLLAVYVGADQLSDGYTHVTASHASGSFLCVQHDLNVMRSPENLAADI